MTPSERLTNSIYIGLDALRIAVIDDNAHFRKIVVAMLNAFGVRSSMEAATEAAGFDLATTVKPDILLVDWNLGTAGNGASLIDRLRTHDDMRIATMAVVLVTAYGSKKRVAEAVRLGANAIVLKPITPRSLYGRLSGLVVRRQIFERSGGRCRPIVRVTRREPTANDGAVRIQPPPVDWASRFP